jgi:hypothetical protein
MSVQIWIGCKCITFLPKEPLISEMWRDVVAFLFVLVSLCCVLDNTATMFGFAPTLCEVVGANDPCWFLFSHVDLLWPVPLHFEHVMTVPIFDILVGFFLVHEPPFSSLSLVYQASLHTQEHLVAPSQTLASCSYPLLELDNEHKFAWSAPLCNNMPHSFLDYWSWTKYMI